MGLEPRHSDTVGDELNLPTIADYAAEPRLEVDTVNIASAPVPRLFRDGGCSPFPPFAAAQPGQPTRILIVPKDGVSQKCYERKDW